MSAPCPADRGPRGMDSQGYPPGEEGHLQVSPKVQDRPQPDHQSKKKNEYIRAISARLK